MGTYVYRVTKDTVVCSDGELANIAEYAYKPSFSFFDDAKLNARWHFRSGCVSSDAMAARGALSGRIVLGKGDNYTIYENVDNLGSFYDYGLGEKKFPKLDVTTDFSPGKRKKIAA